MQEWMGRLWVKTAYYKYQENDRRLKENFINSESNEAITAEVIKEWRMLKDTSEISIEQVLVVTRD